ncbi:MAG: exporter of polyketide antibiotics [Thermoleophilia bacterium]
MVAPSAGSGTAPSLPDGAAPVARDKSPDGAGSGPLTGTGALVRFMLRRDRIKLPAWAGGAGIFMLYLVSAIPAAYGSEEDLQAVSGLFQDPIGRLLIGPGYGLDTPTFPKLIANGYGLYFMLLTALMSILLVTRHTRVEEQTGRAELIRAGVVGRHAPLTAALIVVLITNLAAGAAVFVFAVAAGGFETGGALLFAAGVAAVGLAFAGVTSLTVQLSEYSRPAAGMAGAVLGAAFVLRAGGDMARVGGNFLSWTSPLGWAQQTAPFVLDRWWPLALPLVFASVTAAGGYLLSSRRDLGASMFAARPGSAGAPAWLGTPLGLALRLQRMSIIVWTLALALSGFIYGLFADPLLSALGDLPEAFVVLFGDAEDMLAGYLAYMAVFMAFLAGVYAVLAVQGLRGEETSGRGEPVLATAVSRWAWMGGHLLVTAAGVVVLLAATGAATGLGAAAVTGDWSHLWELTAAHLNQIPAVFVVLGLAAFLFGVAPRAVPIAWVLVVYGVIAGTFAPMLDLPQLVYDLSPFEHPARMPLEGFVLSPLLALTAISLAGAVLGLAAFRRRGVNVA